MYQIKLNILKKIPGQYTDSYIKKPFAFFGDNNILESKWGESYYSYSFDEKVSFHQHSRAELSFKIPKYITKGNDSELNPFLQEMFIGSIIELCFYPKEEDDNRSFYFCVTDISYSFSQQNIIYNVKCQDYFSYVFSRRNNGYVIENKIGTKDFLGSKTIKEWAEKILQDSGIKLDGLNSKVDIDKKYNIPIAFSVSNSNTYNALVSLANEGNLNINIKQNIEEGTIVISFDPKKNNNNILVYSPQRDLKTFSFSQKGEILTTILNVDSKKLPNGKLLSLLPDELFKGLLSVLKRTADDNRLYSDNYYPSMIKEWKGKSQKEPLTPEERELSNLLMDIPWLENKLINLNYFENFNFVKEKDHNVIYNMLYNDLRIANINLLYYKEKFLSKRDILLNEKTVTDDKINQFLSNLNSNILSKRFPKGIEDTNITTFNYLALQKYYNDVLWQKPDNEDIIEWKEQVEEYANNLFNYQQAFLKAAYNFREKVADKKEFNSKSDFILIEDLNALWEEMYSASWHCEYFIPETCFVKKENGNYIINDIDSYVPKVVKEASKKKIFKIEERSKEGAETLSFLNKYTKSTNYKFVELDSGILEDFYFESEHGNQTRLFWNDLPKRLGIDKSFNIINKRQFGGIEPITLSYWIQHYKEDSSGIVVKYNEAEKNQKEVWNNIFKNYSAFLYEHNYQDKYAITVQELHQNAKFYFKDIYAPENQFDLSINNINKFIDDRSRGVRIGDRIQLKVEDFNAENNDLLMEAINQPLFVTDIDVNLREADNVKVVVNTIKYQDRVIQRLVSLIK